MTAPKRQRKVKPRLPRPGKLRPGAGLVFCQVDDKLVDLVLRLARGRLVVDCGAGTGQLGRRLLERAEQVISIDKYPHEETESPVLQRDAETFDLFTGKTFPVFLRPDHSGWVDRVIKKNASEVHEFLYVSLPKNVHQDLDICREYSFKQVKGWKGAEGERAYLVRSDVASDAEVVEFVLAKMPLWSEPWWGVLLRRGDGELWMENANGGRTPIEENWIVKRQWAKDFDELDWTPCLVKQDSEAGWLSPSGEWFGCNGKHHDTYARRILKKEVRELEDGGWVRVYGAVGEPCSIVEYRRNWVCLKRTTPEQRRWLRRHEHPVDDED